MTDANKYDSNDSDDDDSRSKKRSKKKKNESKALPQADAKAKAATIQWLGTPATISLDSQGFIHSIKDSPEAFLEALKGPTSPRSPKEVSSPRGRKDTWESRRRSQSPKTSGTPKFSDLAGRRAASPKASEVPRVSDLKGSSPPNSPRRASEQVRGQSRDRSSSPPQLGRATSGPAGYQSVRNRSSSPPASRNGRFGNRSTSPPASRVNSSKPSALDLPESSSEIAAGKGYAAAKTLQNSRTSSPMPLAPLKDTQMCMLAGDWKMEGEKIGTITGSILQWVDGALLTELSRQGNNIYMEVDGQQCIGNFGLKEGEIHWNDGDVWQKETTPSKETLTSQDLSALAGDWKSHGRKIGTIEGSILQWFDGTSETKVTKQGDNIYMEVDGQLCDGIFRLADGEIQWSDGDVWQKETHGTGEGAEAPKTEEFSLQVASVEPAPLETLVEADSPLDSPKSYSSPRATRLAPPGVDENLIFSLSTLPESMMSKDDEESDSRPTTRERAESGATAEPTSPPAPAGPPPASSAPPPVDPASLSKLEAPLKPKTIVLSSMETARPAILERRSKSPAPTEDLAEERRSKSPAPKEGIDPASLSKPEAPAKPTEDIDPASHSKPEAPAPAKPTSMVPSPTAGLTMEDIKGEWYLLDGGEFQGTISEGIITWEGGQTTKMSIDCNNLVMEVDGELYRGQLVLEGKQILWSDGDSWERKSQPMKSERNSSTGVTSTVPSVPGEPRSGTVPQEPEPELSTKSSVPTSPEQDNKADLATHNEIVDISLIAGDWYLIEDGSFVAKISGPKGCLFWEDDGSNHLSLKGDQIRMKLYDEEYVGAVSLDGLQILWSDGEGWHREIKQIELQETTAPNGVTEETLDGRTRDELLVELSSCKDLLEGLHRREMQWRQEKERLELLNKELRAQLHS